MYCWFFFKFQKKKKYFAKKAETSVQASSCKEMSAKHFWAHLERGSIIKNRDLWKKKYLLSFFQSTIDQKAVTRVKACLDSFVWYNN